ncbi:energy transducer TonB [Chitinimonas naiadis]
MLGLLTGCAKPVAPTAVAMPAEPVAPPAVVETAPPAPVQPVLSRDELLAQYVDKVRRLIRARMVYQTKQGNPEALLEVSLQPDMRVKSVRVVKTSGNRTFDLAVKRAIEKAGSYPALPDGLDFSIFKTHKIKYRLHDLL